MNNSTIELVTFKTKEGVDIEKFKTKAAALEGFLKEQTGFLYRSISVDENDLWHDIIYWQTKAAAEQADKNFRQHPAGIAMMVLIDTNSAKMCHMPAIHEVMSECLETNEPVNR